MSYNISYRDSSISGEFRKTYILNGLAFKFAMNERGIRMNRNEFLRYTRIKEARQHLAASFYISKSGRLLVQEAVTTLYSLGKDDGDWEVYDKIDAKKLWKLGVGAENHPYSWGITTDGRYVAYDYGDNVKVNNWGGDVYYNDDPWGVEKRHTQPWIAARVYDPDTDKVQKVLADYGPQAEDK